MAGSGRSWSLGSRWGQSPRPFQVREPAFLIVPEGVPRGRLASIRLSPTTM